MNLATARPKLIFCDEAVITIRGAGKMVGIVNNIKLTFNSKEDHDKFMKRINQMPDSASALANRKIAKEAGVSIQWGKDHARAKK